MSEIAEFLHHGAEQITPKILEGIHKKLPALKLEFAEIDAPKYPHLTEQLEFLAGVVEDYVEGADDTLPLVAVAEAAGLHTSRIDGSPLAYNRPDPYLPDLVICRAELADAILSALAG